MVLAIYFAQNLFKLEDYKARILRESEPLSDRIPTECHIIQYVTFTLNYYSEFVYCIKQSKLKARNSVPIVCMVNSLVVTFRGFNRESKPLSLTF